ncbi:toxin-antitoxin system protein : Uncharacterized protein OS=uncultured bacterium GN=ACD_45C00672G0002 PE=4 SV=1: DUF1778 [Gemmata massiliana]|uniref:DUF1778 domain-containing protein n=1 Tax=Gemmata massiliana TaxID=1210884 RepID=A0A6P2CWN5_9BACT|nr:DUF1778 domain-containing protein [Gemmata massiliana]VTR93401.1 toxin-antitoxin system protein : Uncharacterized protein OS=uncultured bacterium GN=ACD_45C00672G0002 PE=4 SV=1: DUF1778 [Gemmata massiliana]
MPDRQAQPPVTISVEARTQQRDLIDKAAERVGLTRSDFVMGAACREAEDVVLDQTYFPLDARAFAEFMALLEHPPAPDERLYDLMTAQAPWE